MSSWLLTLFLVQPRCLAPPCLPPGDDPRWDALSGLGGLDGLGDGRDGGRQHDGHQVDLVVPAGLLAGSPRQCCLDVSLQMQNIIIAKPSRCEKKEMEEKMGEGQALVQLLRMKGGHNHHPPRHHRQHHRRHRRHHHAMQCAPVVWSHYCTIEEEGWCSDGLNVTDGSSQIHLFCYLSNLKYFILLFVICQISNLPKVRLCTAL